MGVERSAGQERGELPDAVLGKGILLREHFCGIQRKSDSYVKHFESDLNVNSSNGSRTYSGK